ncbi:ATP-binding protein [Melioribacteraceae bacterium 4301-Me]|uniref:sensor histidine kinase n=1 Tax=Pyranulibacter aquaticus TaxID=3163344 RepID=UPI00359BE245
MELDFTQIPFLLASFIAAAGLIFIIYSRFSNVITSRLFIVTLILVIAYLISHTIHFVIMPSHDVTLLDQSCHSLLLMILLSITFLTFNYPEPKKIGIVTGFIILVPSVVLLILLWSGKLIIESHAHPKHFVAHFTPLYLFYVLWYLILIIVSTILIIIKYRRASDPNTRKQLLFFLFGLIITYIATFSFGIFFPWILGFYYLVEISPLAFLVGFIFFTAVAISKYNMLPAAIEKVHSFSLNKKIFFSALVVVPIIILLIQIPIGRVLFNINTHDELMRFFLHSIFIGLIVSLALSFIILKIIAQPIAMLKEKVLQIKEGNYDVNVKFKSTDEIGELTNAINSMAATLSRNRSELIHREERISILLNAFEKSLAAIAIVNNDLRLVEANPQFYNLIEQAYGRAKFSSIDLLQFQSEPDLFTNIIEEVKTKGKYFGEIKIAYNKNKSKDLLLSVTKIISPNQEQKGYLFVEIDITDKKKLEAEILRSEKLAALGAMSAVLAHEIKTPLTSIKMNVDILSQTLNLNDDDKECLEIIKKETNRLTQLVKEVLQFSKTSELTLSKVNLKFFIEEIFQLAKANNLYKQITFINETDDTDIFVDSDKFKQVMLNLVQNSIDAIENEGTIHLSSQVNEDAILIYIKDNGNGIEEPEKIFDPFFTTKPSGTGLGLSVSQKIIEQHNGTLRLISSKAGETIFEIKLPFRNERKNFSN